LYYLAHLTDVMERVVQLPGDVVDEVVEYVTLSKTANTKH
jgi:hypothetical protein